MPITLQQFLAQTEEPMKKGIVQKITNESIFMPMFSFIQVDGFAYEYGEQATLGSVAFRNLNGSYTDDVGVINPKIETLAIFGGTVKSDRQLVNKQGDKVRASQIMAKTRKMGLFFDKYCIDGDPATTPGQFYGLNARLTGNQLIYAGDNGANLTADMIEQLRDAVVGSNNQKVLVMSKRQRRKASALWYGTTGLRDVKQLDQWDGTPIQVLDEDGDEAAILGQDETRGTSAVTSSAYCVRPGRDSDGEYVQGLIGSQMIEHVAQGLVGTSFLDLVEMNGGLAVFHGRAAARLAGLL